MLYFPVLALPLTRALQPFISSAGPESRQLAVAALLAMFTTTFKKRLPRVGGPEAAHVAGEGLGVVAIYLVIVHLTRALQPLSVLATLC